MNYAENQSIEGEKKQTRVRRTSSIKAGCQESLDRDYISGETHRRWGSILVVTQEKNDTEEETARAKALRQELGWWIEGIQVCWSNQGKSSQAGVRGQTHFSLREGKPLEGFMQKRYVT